MRNKNVFQTSLENVANIRDFYHLNYLNADDVNLIKKIIAFSPADTHELHSIYLKLFTQIFDIKKTLISKGRFTGDLKTKIEERINNTEEDIHQAVEKMGFKFLDLIQKENIEFIKNSKDLINFIHYLTIQKLRTNKIEANINRIPGEFQNSSIKRIWKILKHILATNINYTIFLEKEKYSLVLLNNRSAIPLITSDQPVINTLAIDNEPPINLNLYYPVSPKVAIVFSDQIEYKDKKNIELKESDVIRYNEMIFKKSHEQVYSNDKSTLLGYI